ncbi:MAG TPA: hypothetical protein VFK79_15535 [Xanthobacteraceae bacterium]|nr:hypothetical protein [Xanthobacteraceae bacterium]
MRNHFTFRNAAFFAAGGLVAALFLGGAAQAITDTVFRYNTERIGNYGLSPTAFAPVNDNTSYSISWTGEPFLEMSGGVGCFTTGVNLPHGAKMSSLMAWSRSFQNPQNIHVYLRRTNLSDGTSQTITTLNSNDKSGVRRAMTANLTSSTLNVVNNSQYLYFVAVCIDYLYGEFHGARITYTYTNAGD